MFLEKITLIQEKSHRKNHFVFDRVFVRKNHTARGRDFLGKNHKKNHNVYGISNSVRIVERCTGCRVVYRPSSGLRIVDGLTDRRGIDRPSNRLIFLTGFGGVFTPRLDPVFLSIHQRRNIRVNGGVIIFRTVGDCVPFRVCIVPDSGVFFYHAPCCNSHVMQ